MPSRAEESTAGGKVGEKTMTDGARQRSSTAGSSKDAADEKKSGSNVALKKEIGLVSACGIIVGKCRKSQINLSHEVRRDEGGKKSTGRCFRALASVRHGDACTRLGPCAVTCSSRGETGIRFHRF